MNGKETLTRTKQTMSAETTWGCWFAWELDLYLNALYRWYLMSALGFGNFSIFSPEHWSDWIDVVLDGWNPSNQLKRVVSWFIPLFPGLSTLRDAMQHFLHQKATWFPMNKWRKSCNCAPFCDRWKTAPSLPKSSRYLVSGWLHHLKAFSEGVCGSKHQLKRYLED